MSCSPDRQVRQNPVGTVLAEDGNAAAFGQLEALQVSSHTTDLIGRLRPGYVFNTAVRVGLRQVYVIRCLASPVELTVRRAWFLGFNRHVRLLIIVMFILSGRDLFSSLPILADFDALPMTINTSRVGHFVRN